MSQLKDIFSSHPAYTLAVTEQGEQLSSDDVVALANNIQSLISNRPLVFSLCENKAGSLLGYLSFLYNEWVPVMLDSTIDKELLDNLLANYQPNYIWLPDNQLANFSAYKVCFSAHNYNLIEYCNLKIELNSDLALLLTTSGSTGSPKLVRLSYNNIWSNATSIAEYLNITSEERPITSLPMYYSFGLSIINSHILKGATVLLTDKSIIQKEFWNLAKEQRATSLSGVPYTYEILHKFRFHRMDLPHLKTLTQAGGKLNNSLIEFFSTHSREIGRNFYVMYGQTEATARMSYLPCNYTLEKLGSIGIAIPGGEFSLINDEAKLITESFVAGELVYKGDNVSLGYADCKDDLAKGDENNGVLYTGDIAQKDDDGFYYIVGRKKRFIKIFGNRVNLDASEQLLKTLIQEVACVGIDDKMTIYITDSNRTEELRSYIAHKLGIHISAFQVKSILEIPKSASGKTLYAQLQAE